jgi:Dienelactone hydrolase and related enzymes
MYASHVVANRVDPQDRQVTIPILGVSVSGTLRVPARARGVVLLALDGGGRSSEVSVVATELHRGHFATLVCDLAAPREPFTALWGRANGVGTPLLATRLAGVAQWIRHESETMQLPIGYFGAGLAAAAALTDAAQRTTVAHSVVCCGGRPDLAAHLLPDVHLPTLLLVGGFDEPVVDLNRDALRQLGGIKALEIVPRATHLLEEPDAAARVARRARRWFERHLDVHAPHITRSGGGW